MNFLLLIKLIFILHSNLAVNLDREIIVDFNETISEINISNFLSKLRFICNENCKLIFGHSKSLENRSIKTEKNNFTISSKNKLELIGNYTFCKRNQNESSFIEYFDLPNCCPCCVWYEQNKCDKFIEDTQECSVVIVYFYQKNEFNFQLVKAYKNVYHLLPCKMRFANMNDTLKIFNTYTKAMYYNSASSNKSILEKSLFIPSVGFCFNTSVLKESSQIQCEYPNKEVFTYNIRLIDFEASNLTGSLYFVDEQYKINLHFKRTNIKLLRNQTVKLGCKGKHLNSPWHQITCMKFGEEFNITKNDYYCEEEKELEITININTKSLKNQTEILCLVEKSSKTESQKLKFFIDLVDNKSLEIINFNNLNNKSIEIFQGNKLEIIIPFESIPSNEINHCEIIEYRTNKSIICEIKFVGECSCTIYFKNVNLTEAQSAYNILIYNEHIKKSITVHLKPIYLFEPKFIEFTSLFENHKKFKCQISSSKPFNITWRLIYNKFDKYIHVSKNDEIIIKMNNSIQSICATCELTNQLGSELSNEICIDITDIIFDRDNLLQMFIINATIWNSKLKSINYTEIISNKNNYVELLDYSPIILLCASRIKNQPINIIYNNTIMNTTISNTIYTKRIYLKYSIKTIKTKYLSGVYICEQNNINQNNKLKSEISIQIIQSISPKILLGKSKWDYMTGQDVHISFTIISLPLMKWKLFKIDSKNYKKNIHFNETESFKFIINNSTHSLLNIEFKNVSKEESGFYLLVTENEVGNKTAKFNLSFIPQKSSSNIYYAIGGVLFIFILIFCFLVKFFQRSGYAVPIIQIQNSMYKSLDIDSIQLLNHIWTDPLDKMKWTIKSNCRIKIINEIGKGNYGKIYKGILINPNSTIEQFVALKQPILMNQTSRGKLSGPMQFCQISLDCFMNEIRILSKLTDCPNVIKMIGCKVFQNGLNLSDSIKEPTTVLVLEYYCNKSLNEFLIKNATMFSPFTKFRKLTELNGYTDMKLDEGITLLDLKKISLGIATGLEYLNQSNIIHRDLATRNILIDENKIPKICDFGLAIEFETDINYYTTYHILTYNKALPFKILAPEVLESNSFCLKSDIWSFGLLLWEMFNLEQEQLFSDFENPSNLLKYIRNRLVDLELKDLLPVPKYADSPIWDLIRSCWKYNPFERPSASLIKIELTEIVRSSPIEVIHVSNIYESQTINTTNEFTTGINKLHPLKTNTTTNLSSKISEQNPYCFDFSTANLADESPL